MLAFALALVILDRRGSRGTPDAGDGRRARSTPAGGTALTVVAGLALVAALATSVQVYRVGDSGARAAWGDRVSSSANR
jgi:hypothetical protein